MLSSTRPGPSTGSKDIENLNETGAPDHTRHLRRLNRKKRIFVLIAATGILIFNLAQPVLSVFTTILDAPAFAGLSWGWVYAIAQFVVPLALLQTYRHYMTRWEKEAFQAGRCSHG